jgi:hypothetical protein
MKGPGFLIIIFFSVLLIFFSCRKDSAPASVGTLHLSQVKFGNRILTLQGANTGLPVDSAITVSFNEKLDTASARSGAVLKKSDQSQVPCRFTWSSGYSTFKMIPYQPLDHSASYVLQINTIIKGAQGETFPGVEYAISTIAGTLSLETITLNGVNFKGPAVPSNIDWKSVTVHARFSEPLDSSSCQSAFQFSPGVIVAVALSADKKEVTVTNGSQLADLTKYTFNILPSLKAKNGYMFGGFHNFFYTRLDSTPKFPLITDDELLTLIQQRAFKYFYDFGHPVSGMARERNNSGDIVTTGGSGFGVMALVVGMNRGFISRNEGLARLAKIVGFLETCDRFHGAWPHWLNGTTGKVVPFSSLDNGGDLVETSYMVQGLYTVHQYLDASVPAEKLLIDRIGLLISSVEYDWYTRGQNVLYWHWSPVNSWAMNMAISGYNETLITYVVAAASTTHSITAATYHQGYARNGAIRNGNSYYGYVLPLGESYGGPLFFTQYSFLGLKPVNLTDSYASYWQQNVNQTMINRAYCMANPRGFIGYSSACWGLTACDNPWGYNAHSPTNDLGVIAPTAAISSLPFTPEQSMQAIRFFYYQLGNKLWGEYGFYDSFDITEGWWANSTLAIDQGPIICMIENYRTGLLWNNFMSNPEVQAGLTKLGFTY